MKPIQPRTRLSRETRKNTPPGIPRRHVNRAVARTMALAMCWLAWSPLLMTRAQSPISESEFEPFSAIVDKNIFNENRSSRPPPAPVESPPEPVRSESIVLLGTLIYENNRLAFFDGTNPANRRTVAPGDTIAGCRLAAVEPDHVRLETEETTIRLGVGRQMKRDDDEPWRLSEEPVTNQSEASKPAAPGQTNPEEADILKRLMQQREEELNQ